MEFKPIGQLSEFSTNFFVFFWKITLKSPIFNLQENPKIDQIFDTPDKEFATKVAYVSHEEWVVFQDLKEQEEATAEKDRPFEK